MITSLEDQKVQEVEKNEVLVETLNEKSSLDIQDGDEALRLIGAERTAQFSEEYNLKLRRKLVRPLFLYFVDMSMSTLLLGHDNSAVMRCCVLHPVSVSVDHFSSQTVHLTGTSETRPL